MILRARFVLALALRRPQEGNKSALSKGTLAKGQIAGQICASVKDGGVLDNQY